MNPPKTTSALQHSTTPPLHHSGFLTLRLLIPPALRLLIPVLALIASTSAATAETLRIGYQKAASTLVLLKTHGTLEKKLAPLNVEVKWLEFAAGPQLLEGLNLGSIG